MCLCGQWKGGIVRNWLCFGVEWTHLGFTCPGLGQGKRPMFWGFGVRWKGVNDWHGDCIQSGEHAVNNITKGEQMKRIGQDTFIIRRGRDAYKVKVGGLITYHPSGRTESTAELVWPQWRSGERSLTVQGVVHMR